MQNVAKLYDSAGNDHFYADVDKVIMSGTGFELQAYGFAYAHGYATYGGVDSADMYDSAGDDAATFYRGFLTLYDLSKTKTDPGFYYRRSNQFESITVHAVNGNAPGSTVGDVRLTCTIRPATDVFTAAPDEASMEINVGVDGTGQPTYSQKATALGFSFVHAYGTNGGTDERRGSLLRLDLRRRLALRPDLHGAL